MNNIKKRFFMFLGLCISTRIFFVYYAKQTDIQTLKRLGYIALVPAIGFMYIYLTGSRQTGAETQGAKIWWNDLRPLHSLFYFSFAYIAINGDQNNAYKALLIDVIIGLISFLMFHHGEGNFKKLM